LLYVSYFSDSRTSNFFQITLLLMQHMPLLLSRAPPADIRLHVLPMLYRALEANSPQIQDMALAILPSIASLVDFTAMKNALVPRIRKLCLATSALSVSLGYTCATALLCMAVC